MRREVNMVFYRIRYTGTFFAPFDLNSFPFDLQTLPLVIETRCVRGSGRVRAVDY